MTEVVKEDVVLHILQHVARLMASYFTNTSLIFTSPFSRSALSQSANMFLGALHYYAFIKLSSFLLAKLKYVVIIFKIVRSQVLFGLQMIT